MPHLAITEVGNCQVVVSSEYQHDLIALYTLVPNKPFIQLLDILPKNFTFLKTFNSEISHLGVWFTDQNSKPLEIQEKISIILVIN